MSRRRRRARGDPLRLRSADRDRRLADAECESALRGREPPHHCAAARGVHTRAERARREQRGDECAVRVRPAPARRATRRREAERDHELLADAIGEEAPREEREQHPDPDRTEHDAGLAEREAVARPQRRRKRRQPDGEAPRSSPARACLLRGSPSDSALRPTDLLCFVDLVCVGPWLSGPAVSSTAGRPWSRRLPRKTPRFSPSSPSPMFA